MAQFLNLSEKRIRQLRDEEIIKEARPGLYDLKQCVGRYIEYIRGGAKSDLQEERALLTAEKRKAAEMDNKERTGELLQAAEVEKSVSTMVLNFRSRMLAMPQKLAHELAGIGGNELAIMDRLELEVTDLLEELSRYETAMADGENHNEKSEEAPMQEA